MNVLVQGRDTPPRMTDVGSAALQGLADNGDVFMGDLEAFDRFCCAVVAGDFPSTADVRRFVILTDVKGDDE